VLNNLAWLYATTTDLSIRDGNRAIALAQEALLIQPDDHHVWSTLSAAHYIVGNYDRALRAAEEAVRLGERMEMNPEGLQNYRQQAQRCRQAAEALSILD
jgi:tetratricopeptide (TPR) repeat protein